MTDTTPHQRLESPVSPEEQRLLKDVHGLEQLLDMQLTLLQAIRRQLLQPRPDRDAVSPPGAS